MIKQRISISLAITALVSTVFSLFLVNFGFNFFISFLAFTLFQFIGFYFYGEYIKQKNARLAFQAELKNLEFLEKITTEVICPCDKRVATTIPLSLTEKNFYNCAGCNKKISVLLEPKTALATEPQDETFLDDPEFINQINELLKQQSNAIQRSSA